MSSNGANGTNSSSNGTRRRMAIIGDDDREIKYSDFDDEYPYHGVGVLHSDGDNGGTYLCTATMVSSRVLLTAAHCVFDTQSDDYITTNLRFYPGAAARGSLYINDDNKYDVDHVGIPVNYVDATQYTSNYDYALLVTSESMSASSAISYGYLAVDNSQDYTLNTVGCPGDKIYRIYEECLFDYMTSTAFWSMGQGCDVIGGQSGSPLYDDNGDVVAVLVAGQQ
eukprot:TRINITY_DN1747_c0_g1_i4.p1 TRINITY_DN1747_c0_g1~~TRINITY_DN1747_c0_g1_i4.p1  ORF type:complete len:224 (-),score=37.28 TRINITY_DN1747_c0_g1_i4:212-883(-)